MRETKAKIRSLLRNAALPWAADAADVLDAFGDHVAAAADEEMAELIAKAVNALPIQVDFE